MSFCLKTILGIALIESVLLLILVASSLSYLYESNEKQLLERATTTSRLFASAAKDAVLATDLARLNSLAVDMLTQSDVAYVRVRDAADKVLVAVGDAVLLEQDRAIDKQLITVDDGVFDTFATIEEVGIHFGRVELGLSTLHVENLFTEAQQWFSTIAITEVLLVALFSFLLGTYLSRGLLKLRDASQTIRERGPGVQLSITGNDEIADVAKAFNEMSRSLQNSYEQLRLASLEAKKADEAKGRFLAVMSHEIRTPMNAVLGILDLLKETPLTAKQRHLLDTGCESSELLLSIINSILDFSKMEAGKLQLDLRPFDLHQALRNVVELFRAQAEQKQIQLALHLDATLPNFVKGDQYRLRQILVNLIGNAIKFTDQGAITVSVRAQPQDADTVRIVCRVEDTGIGIPEDQQGILFQEFSMVDQSHSRHADGTGLGLAISKWLVNLMHGEIGVSSQPGVGSCFNFRVYVALASAEEVAQLTQLPHTHLPSLSARILLAEDNPANQKIFKAMLENTGLHVDVVGDGYEAVEAVRSQNYDLVLMDVSMPRMDGIEATHAIRHLEPPCSNIPIIAMTAHSLSGDRERLIAEGMNDYLSKPLKKSDLLQGILRWISPPAPMEHQVGEEIKASKPCTESQPNLVATQLIDESVLQQLVRDTSAEVVPELLRGYIEDAFQRVELIKAAIDERNAKQLEFETHTLGSSAAAYGNPELYRLAREIEQRCRAKDVEGAFETALPLETLAVASLTALTQRLDKGF